MMNKYAILLLFLLFGGVNTTLTAQCPAVTGRVFTDFDEDGVYDTPVEVGLENVLVTAFDNDNNIIGTDLTDGDGLYSVNTSGANATALCPDGSYCYRVEFTLPANHVAWAADAGMGAEVQRVCDNNCTADLASYCKFDYCDDSPGLTTPCYIDGANNGSEDVLVSFDFNNPSAVRHEAVENAIATTYGLAYSSAAGGLFAGAFQKRFAGYGSGTTGSIYYVDSPNDNVNSGALFVDLNTLFGSNVAGNDPHDFTTFSSNTASGNRFVDEQSFDAVNRVSLGDLELSEDALTLYVINFNDRSLYALPLGTDPANPVAPTLSSQVTVTQLANPANPLPDLPAGISNEEIIPFGLEVHKEKVYIGLVTNGQTNGLANMHGLVYSYEPGTGAFAKVLQFPLNYARGCGFGSTGTCYGAADWQPWLSSNIYPTPVFDRFNEVAYPQPALADIGFDVRGNMVVSLRDRWGDQGGYRAPRPNDNGSLKHYDAFGDILYATNNGDDTWSINIADFTDSTNSVGTSTTGTAAPCPDGENFFGDDCYNGDAYIHEETNFSGITVHLPSDQVASIAMDPNISAFSTGVDWHDLETGTQNSFFQILTQAQANAAGEFGKGNGFGDLELICAQAPIEVGNYVWLDTDADGIQDPCESPIQGVTVQLYDDTGILVGTATTDARGRYNFGGIGNVNMAGGNPINYLSDYEIRVALSDAETAAVNQGLINGDLLLTGDNTTDDRSDSDATLSGGNAVIAFTTGRAGDNNHNYDLGFFECETITNPSADDAVCSGEAVTGISVSTSATDANSIRFVYFTTPQTGGNMYSGGTDIGTVSPAVGTATAPSHTFPANNTATNVIYYVYAVLNPTPTDASCRPSQEIEITVYPDLNAAPESGNVCVGESVAVNGNASDGSGTYTMHQWTDLGTGTASGYTLSGTTTPTLTLNATGANAGTVNLSYAVTDNNGCSVTVNSVITIHPLPIANDAALIACESVSGSGFATFDLSSADVTVTGGSAGASVTYYRNSALTDMINNPATYTTGSAVVYAQVTSAAGCESNGAEVTLTVATISPVLSDYVCYNNYTAGNENDDYYTITVNAAAGNPGGSNTYEVVLNAAADGSGGTVLGSSNFGNTVTVGTGGELAADGNTDYILTIRDADNHACHAERNTGILQECSECPTRVCLPVTLTKN